MRGFLIILAGGLVKNEKGKWHTTLGDDELGCSGILNDRLRVVAGAELWKENNDLRIIACGGQGKLKNVLPKDLSTSKVIKGELIELGVPAKKITEENQSGTTFEQLNVIREMIERGEISGDIFIISNNYHLPRIQAMIDYTELKKSLAGKVKLVGAEDVLLRLLPEEWKDFIEKFEKSEVMKERLENEKRGIGQIKSGEYKFVKKMKLIKTIKIGRRLIGEGQPTFIVAEMSANHGQSFEKAVQIIKAAKWAGADAIKLQTFTPDTMTIDSDKKWFQVGGEKNPKSWKGQTFYDLYKKAYTPWRWFPKLKKIAEELGLVFFSTPFDVTAIDFLEKLKVPCYKIAAYESIDVPLLRKVAKTGKPIIVSVGFSTLDEVKMTVGTLKKAGAKNIVVLQCTTSYSDRPKVEKTNLKTMLDIKKRFGALSGLSDNMGGIEVPVLASALGASVIEKHIVAKHGLALDDRFSLDKEEFKKMVDEIRNLESDESGEKNKKLINKCKKMIGRVSYGPQTSEEKYNRNFRRSLFVIRDIKKGEKFTEKNIRSIRPGYGLPPKYFDAIIGRKAKVNLEKGTPLNLKIIQ